MVRLFAKVSLILLWSRVAAAEAPTSHTEVHWKAIEGCPSENALRGLVEERLGQALDVQREQSLRVDASLSRGRKGDYRVIITTRGASGRGRRQLSDTDCDRLAEAAALVIAIAIDPKQLEAHERTVARASSEPSEPRSEPGRHTPIPQPDVAATGKPKAQVTLSGTLTHARELLRLEARPFVGTGWMPKIDLGAMALVGYFPLQRLELRAAVGALIPESKPVGFATGALSMKALALDAGVCMHPLVRKLQPYVCAITQVGFLFADGENLTNPQSQRAMAVSFLAELGYAHYFGERFGGCLSVQAGVTPVRPRFGVLRNGVSTQVFRPNAGTGRIGLALFWLFR